MILMGVEVGRGGVIFLKTECRFIGALDINSKLHFCCKNPISNSIIKQTIIEICTHIYTWIQFLTQFFSTHVLSNLSIFTLHVANNCGQNKMRKTITMSFLTPDGFSKKFKLYGKYGLQQIQTKVCKFEHILMSEINMAFSNHTFRIEILEVMRIMWLHFVPQGTVSIVGTIDTVGYCWYCRYWSYTEIFNTQFPQT